MKSYQPKDVRVVGFFGHRGAGKTSAIEGMLFNAGVTTRLGNVDEGRLTLDADPDAAERHTTMHATAGWLDWGGVRVTVVDTPGDGNFWGTTARVIPVIDSAIVFISSTSGMEPMALRTIQELSNQRVPFAIVLSKLDKENADFAGTLAAIRGDLPHEAVPISLPIGQGGDFAGTISLLSQKAYLPAGDTTSEAPIPAELAETVKAARERMFDCVAAADDELAQRFLEAGTLTEEELIRGLQVDFLKCELIPVLAADPHRNIGMRVLLDFIAQACPSPLSRPPIKGFTSSKCDQPIERLPSVDGPLVARVFATHHDPFAGLLSYARVYSGKLVAAHDLWNSTRNAADRPSHIYIPQGDGKNGYEIKEARPGDIVALTKLKLTHTGDSLSSKDAPFCFVKPSEPDALLQYGISAGDQKSEERMAQLIQAMIEEDPSLTFRRDGESKESILGGLGQAHIEHVVDRLKRVGITVTLREPKIPYRETFRSPIRDVEGKHKKQTGGSGQFGVCNLHVEPLPRGSGIEFVDAVVGGAIPRNYIQSVEKGVREALKHGPISGCEVVDVRVTLYDGKYHRVDSSDIAFQLAAQKAIKAAYASRAARPLLLEPYVRVEISCPAGSVGDLMGDLNARRARVSDMTTEGKNGRVEALVPYSEMLKYANVLKSITSGRGSFSMRLDHYEEAPPDVQQKIASSYTAPVEKD